MMMAPGTHGPTGNVRNPVMVLLIGWICFIYALIVLWSQLNELKAFRQRDDITPILFFVPVLNIILLWGLPEKVREAKQMAGIANPQVAHPILYVLLAGYAFTNDLNEVFQAAAARQQYGGALPPHQ